MGRFAVFSFLLLLLLMFRRWVRHCIYRRVYTFRHYLHVAHSDRELFPDAAVLFHQPNLLVVQVPG